MREIKFRAWDKIHKEMLYNVLEIEQGGFSVTSDLPQHEINLATGREAPMQARDFIWQQFTGLLDKNGTDIYEGDIVRAYKHGEPIGEVVFSKYVTDNEQNEDILGWCIATGERYYALDPQSSHEVIGNIYQNPELLSAGIGGDKNGR